MGQDPPLLTDRAAQARCDELANKRLLMPLRGADGSEDVPVGFSLEEITGQPEDRVVPVTLVGPGRAELLLLFTDTTAVHRWRASARYMSAPGHLLFELADRIGVSEVVIDAEGAAAVRIEVSREEPLTPAESPWDVRALSGPIDPRALFRLRSVFESAPAVAAVYVAELCRPDQSATLVVAFDIPGVGEPAAHATIKELIPRIGELLPADLYATGQFVALTDDEFAPLVRAADAPIYRRP